jgi:hypothetical protein
VEQGEGARAFTTLAGFTVEITKRGRASLGLTDTMELRCHRPALTGSAGSDDRRGELSRTLEFMPMNLDAQVRGYSAKPEGFLPGGSP